MNLKTALTVALLTLVPNCGKKASSTQKVVSAVSKEVLKSDTLKANFSKIKPAPKSTYRATKSAYAGFTRDSFYTMHPKYRPDTIIGNSTANYLAEEAKKNGTDTAHLCWRYGKKAHRSGLGVDFKTGSAYMAAEELWSKVDPVTYKPYYLELTNPNSTIYKNNEVVLGIMGLNKLYIENPNNMEIKREFQKSLSEGLPKGVSLVWDKLRKIDKKTGREVKYNTGDWKQHGHYGITIGNGKERSWKTMDIVVFPTKLRLFIPNFFPSDHKLNVPQKVALPQKTKTVADTLALEEERKAATNTFLTKTTKVFLTR